MFKIIAIALSLTLFSGCSSAFIKEKRTAPSAAKEVKLPDEKIDSDWSHYSYGLYYKNQAKSERERDRRTLLLKKAIEQFIDAARSGRSLGMIYFQLSDCYYALRDYDKSIEYGEKSIGINKNNPSAYSRLYYTYMVLRNYKGAAKVYENYLKIFPDDIRIRYILSEHYYKRMNDYDQSIDSFLKVIEIAHRISVESFYVENAYYSLGYLKYKTGDIKSSIDYYNRVREVNSENINAAYMLAYLSMENYDLENAEKNSDIFLSINPGNQVMLSIKGRIAYLTGDPTAIRYLRIAKKSNTIEGFLARGLYLMITGKSKEAEKYLKTVVKYRPKYISSHMALAEIESERKNVKSAFNEYITAGVLAYKKKLFTVSRKCFHSALSFQIQVPEVYYYMGRVYEEMGNNSLAILNYKKVHKLKESLDMLLHIGYLYGLKKDTANSIKYFDMAINREPENSKPYFYKGLGFLRGNNYNGAEENLKKAIGLNRQKNKEKYYFYLAIVQEKQNKFNEAVESLETAIRHNPKSARAYNYLGYLFAEKNIHIDRSYDLIRKALKIDPGNGAYLDSLGWVYYRKGDYRQALKNLLQAEKELKLSKSPDPVVYDHIGDTYEKIGDLKKAVDYWKKSIEIKKDGKIEGKIRKIQGMEHSAR